MSERRYALEAIKGYCIAIYGSNKQITLPPIDIPLTI